MVPRRVSITARQLANSTPAPAGMALLFQRRRRFPKPSLATPNPQNRVKRNVGSALPPNHCTGVVEIPYPDRHRVLAAQGWLELKMPREAQDELAGLSASTAQLALVMELGWRALADQGLWREAWSLAEATVAAHPDGVSGWIHRAYAARRAPDGGIPAARRLLEEALKRFPFEPMIPYNLACYAVQLQELDEGWNYLQLAATISTPKEIRSLAERDEDLRPFWPRLGEL